MDKGADSCILRRATGARGLACLHCLHSEIPATLWENLRCNKSPKRHPISIADSVGSLIDTALESLLFLYSHDI